MNLRAYDRMKLELGELLLSAWRAAGEWSDQVATVERECLSRLAGDHFRVVVTGREGSAAIAFANALIGGIILPSDSLRLGPVPLRVRYGASERVRVEYQEKGRFGEARLSDLSALVTEEGNPGNVKQLQAVEVRMPGESLRRGLCLLVARAGACERVVSGGDALVLVTEGDDLSGEELQFLERVCGGFAALFVAMHGARHGETDTRLGEVEGRLRALEHPPVRKAFHVALARGLACGAAHDIRGIRDSGFLQLEGTLLSFLTRRGAEALVTAVGECLPAVLAKLPEAERDGFVRRLEEIQEQARRDPDSEEWPGAVESAAEDVPPRGAVACAICVEVKEQGFKYLSRYQFELVSHRQVREEHARAGGFCPRHTWQYERIASLRGVSTCYPVVLESAARRLRKLAHQDGSAASGEQLLPTHCPACAVQRATEERAIGEVLAQPLASAEEVRSNLPWICLPHLERLLERPQVVPLRNLLLEIAASRLERVVDDMRRCLLKDEGLRRELVSEEEREAPVRALGMVVGHEGTAWSRETPAEPSGAALEAST